MTEGDLLQGQVVDELAVRVDRLSHQHERLWVVAAGVDGADQIGTVDTSGDDPAALSLVAEPINPNGNLVHDLALEQVSVGHGRSRPRFGQ